LNPRALWTPKRREVPAQCASCPFRVGNDKEFSGILSKLKAKLGLKPSVKRPEVVAARCQVRMDLEHTGDFACHHTAYDEAMNERPASEHRQCAGATRWFREGK